MNLTKEEKDYIKSKVIESFDNTAPEEYQKACSEEKKLILSSDIFKRFETEVFVLSTNSGHPQTDITNDFCFYVREDCITLKYNSNEIGICYEKYFDLTKLNKSIRCFRPITLHWGDSEYDSLFSKTFIEVKDLKTKRTRLSVINDIIDKLNKETITRYKNKGKERLKDIKDILPLLNTTYYPQIILNK